MTKFNIGDRVKDVSNSAPVNPYGVVHSINAVNDDYIQICWDHNDITGSANYIGGFHPASDFILVESAQKAIEPWNLMEVVKVEDFLGVV